MANTKKKLTQLDRIEKAEKEHTKSKRRLTNLESAARELYFLRKNDNEKHVAAYTGFASRIAALEDALLKSPVEEVKEWVPKVGEYFVSTHDNSKVSGNYKWSNVLMLALVGKTRKCLDHLGGRVYDGEFYWTAKDLRPATPEEIATYEQEKEATAAQGIVTAAESGSHSDATEPVDSPVAKGDVPKPH